MDTFSFYIPIIITVLILFPVYYGSVEKDFEIGQGFSISMILVGLLSIFIFFSDSWTFKRWFNRLYFPTYTQSDNFSKYIVDNLYSDIKVSEVLNVVVVKWKIIDEDIKGQKLREFERNLIDFGGGEKYKTELMEDLMKDDTVIDYLQQGLELNLIISDKYKELLEIIITYDDIVKFQKEKSK